MSHRVRQVKCYTLLFEFCDPYDPLTFYKRLPKLLCHSSLIGPFTPNQAPHP